MPGAYSVNELRGLLLTQCGPGEVDSLAGIADGIVVTKPTTLVRDFPGSVLHDRARYTGKHRAHARSGIDLDWIKAQQNAGCIALTDSGFLHSDDWPGLHGILDETERLPQPVIAVLPMTPWYLATAERVRQLADAIASRGVPVAIALEHRADPFGVRGTLRGFVSLLELLGEGGPEVLLLRCDASALGALAHGVLAAAVGTRSSLRHIPLPDGGGPVPPGNSVFVPKLLRYQRLDRIGQVVSATRETLSQLWECGCPVCEGRELDWLADGGEAAAREHSIRAQYAELAELFRTHRERMLPAEELWRRRSIWYERCGHALFVHQQLADELPKWRSPAAIGHWYQLEREFFEARTMSSEGVDLDTVSQQDSWI